MGNLLVHNPNKLSTVDYRELKPLQGSLKDLTKKNYTKLLNSIKEHGFFIPAYVWIDGSDYWIMDAHQRHRVLTTEKIKFENTGYEIPYVEIQADDKKDAAVKLLKIASQYGTVNQEGIDQFIATYELPEAEVYEATHFDAIIDYSPSEVDISLPDGDDPEFQQMTFTIHNDQKLVIDEALTRAKSYITGDEPNENSNGNALFYLAENSSNG